MFTLKAPEIIKKEDIKFFNITQIVYIFGALGHINAGILFIYLSIYEMVIFNFFFSIPAFTISFFLNRKGYLSFAFAIAASELYLHQTFSVYFLGWNSGFQYFLIYLAILVFFNFRWGRKIHLLSVFFISATFTVLYIFFREPHKYALTSGQYDFLFLLNSLGTIILTVILTNYFVKAANRSETVLEGMVKERTLDLEKSQRDAISMLGEAGHFNDNETGIHIWRMASFASLLAEKTGWSRKDSELLELAATMHDTGKIGMPDSVLKKQGKLNDEEWKIMKSHAKIGHEILSESDTPLFRLASTIALYHHEKWDGTGYPEGLRGEAIPLEARIVAIADVFDALTMERPYKKAWTVDDALDEIRNLSGKHLDPSLTGTFINMKDELIDLKKKWDL